MQSKLHLEKTIYAPAGQKMADILCRQIRQGNYAPCEKLPSIRTLAERWNVGRQVVLSAIAILSRNGLVYTDSKRGTFVSPTLGKGLSYKIALFINLENPMIHGNELNKVYRVARHEGFTAVCISNFGEDWTLSDWLERGVEIDGLIVTGIVDDALLEPLKKRGIPYCVLGNYGISPVHPQSKNAPTRKMIRRMSDIFSEGKRNSIAAITGTGSLLSHRQSLQNIREAIALAGKTVREELLYYCDDDGYSIVKELLEERHPDVIVFCVDHWLGYLKYLKQHPDIRRPYIVVTGMYKDEAPYPFFDVNVPFSHTLEEEAKTITLRLIDMIKQRYEIQ